jgi:glyoxylase-like metal-dependent hydrolase (beta-lactamase superfamily II)
MSEVLPGVHQVEGIDPAPDFTTHVLLLRDQGSTWTLIDTGLPGSDSAILRYMEKHRIEPSSIRQILLTHLHLDHVGNLRRMKDATGAKIFAHWLEAAFIARDPPYDGPGAHPKESVQVDEKLKDGDRIEAGGGLIAYHTPGHTPGHTAYYQPERKILFSGDLFFGSEDGLDLTPPEYTHHMLTSRVSARRVGALAVESVMSYHGGPILKKGSESIKKLLARLDSTR